MILKKLYDHDNDFYDDIYIRSILDSVKSIAVVGASSKPDRDSYKVIRTLLENNYKVFPINPNEIHSPLLGQKCYSNLKELKQRVDMVDVFRANHEVLGIAKDSVKIGARCLWTQLGIVNKEAAQIAENAGIRVVMNRCPKIELEKLHWTTKTK